MNFYKNVIEHRGKLLIRGVLNGKEYKEKIDFHYIDGEIVDNDDKHKEKFYSKYGNEISLT